MRIDLLSREYPPHVYGGAGVHVTELAKVLREHADVRVHCFDGPRKAGEPGGENGVTGYSDITQLSHCNPAIRTLGVDLAIANDLEGADIVHSHTWYANMAGQWGSLLYDIPHVMSAHSLEPLRPWKAEQLGGGYRISSWAENQGYTGAAGIVAVSHAMKADILRCYPQVKEEKVRVIHNGIDLAVWNRPETEADKAAAKAVLDRYGIDPTRPTVVFVGRITRQKGLPYMLRALRHITSDAQIVLCAGAPDTPQIADEVAGLVEGLREDRGGGVIHISDMLPPKQLQAVVSAGTVFVTPSVYEPLGIVNLEAMALSLPVVATRTGGIPDVVVDGETGYLVPIEQMTDGTGTPLNPDQFESDMAERIMAVLNDPVKAKNMGEAGRKRAAEMFSWEAIGARTMEFYRDILS